MTEDEYEKEREEAILFGHELDFADEETAKQMIFDKLGELRERGFFDHLR